jgi:hypothetical protein
MILQPHDAELFFKIWCSLLCHVNKTDRINPSLKTPEQIRTSSSESKLEIRTMLFANQQQMIKSFVEENPYDFTEDILDIVTAFRNGFVGKFIILKSLKPYTIFLSTDSLPRAFGVKGLTTPYEDVLNQPLPAYYETVLLPFKGSIITDGILCGGGITFGAGIRRSFNEGYKKAKATNGIITSLPVDGQSITPRF